ncbi:MAG TPA: DUF5606 domain-containing protein [Bacteroidia bacterium]|nr:DUF5606 domain-containing protein [Bacteroidia bacterium]HNS13378.1 DUF5606 domain-containing protein [Bacteroidia bacterium]
MELKDIISVPGMSGLFKVVGNNKNGFIVESMLDNKRSMISSSQRILTLVDIGVYTSDEEMPLNEVFLKIQESGKDKDIDVKGDPKKMREFFKSVVPTFDEERVYDSDIKKVLSWYLLLNGKVDFSKVEEVDEKLAQHQDSEKHIPKIHEAHGPKEMSAKATSARTRKKV